MSIPAGTRLGRYEIQSVLDAGGMGEVYRAIATDTKPEFAPPAFLLFLRESTLMAQRFDMNRLELSGDPFQVAQGVDSNVAIGAAGFTVSENGVLAYRTGSGGGTFVLAWFARTGEVEGSIGAPALYGNPTLSPDGRRLAVFKEDGGDTKVCSTCI